MAGRDKEPGLFRQIVAIHYEQAKRRKALRLLEKQEWGVEFLSALIAKAAKEAGRPVQMEVVSRGGTRLLLSSAGPVQERLDDDSSIFDKLDDRAAVEKFIRDHSSR